MYGQKSRPVDVICQHNRDGRVIPIKVRVKDEEGEYQVYSIKSYRALKNKGDYTTIDGIYVTNRDLLFDCRIMVFGKARPVRLYYDPNSNIWYMGV